MKARRTSLRLTCVGLLAPLVLGALYVECVAQDPGSGLVNAQTWQFDTHRTGQNLKEGTLTYSNLNSTQNPNFHFGQLCSLQLDGQVHGQPLVVTNSKISGTTYPYVVYVVTENDTLYAIDGTPPAGGGTCGPIASLQFLTTGATNGHSAVDCSNLGNGNGSCPIMPVVGILGTPVVTFANHTATIYVVTETQLYNSVTQLYTFYHYLHVVDLPTLTENAAAVQVYPPGDSQSQASFWSQQHIQRPGLLFASPYIYAAFSMMDGNAPLPNGSIFRYDTTNWSATPLYFPTTQEGLSKGGGVWQGAAGLAYGLDKNQNNGGKNYIYFNTGNGDWDGSSNFADSFVKLDPLTLATPPADYFTPADQFYRNCKSPTYTDLDFGSGGVMLIPDTELAHWPYSAVTGDKEGGIWFMDRGSPGKYNSSLCSSTCSSACIIPGTDPQNIQGNIQTYWTGNPNAGQTIHNNPTYWEYTNATTGDVNYLYMSTTTVFLQNLHGKLTQYPLCAKSTSQYPIGSCGAALPAVDLTGASVDFPYGVTPSVSAANSTDIDAVVWAIWGDGSILTKPPASPNVGRLLAFDAISMQQLYASSGNGSPCPTTDALTVAATRYSVPTVANGYVYLGAQGPVGANGNGNAGMFYIFGPGRTCH